MNKERSQRIVLYGKTLIMDTIGRNIQRMSGCEVTSLLETQQTELEKIAPDVVFFDLNGDHPAVAFSMLDCHPDLLIIGINPDINEVRMWTAKQIRKVSTQDLLAFLNEKARNILTFDACELERNQLTIEVGSEYPSGIRR